MSLEKAIKKTIDYGRRYGCELGVNEIKERLISDKIYKDETHPSPISSEGPPTLSGVSMDLKREVLVKIKKVNDFIKLIKNNFDDVLFVGITGSVAAGYPKKNDDIDLIIITRRNRLWWTRLKLRYLVYKNNIPHRKYGQKENKDEFCFNFWLDEESLLIPKNRQNLRSAMDLILMKQILNRENVYERFILKNDWAKRWVATGYSKLDVRSSIVDRRKTDNLYWWIVNLLLFIPQYLFMKRKMKNGEEVGLGRAIFNER